MVQASPFLGFDMVDTVSLRNVATRLIRQNGRTVTLVKHSRESIGPAHRGRIENNDISVGGIYAVFANFRSNQIDGTLIKEDDKLLLISSQDIPSDADADIENYDEVIDEGQTWSIERVQEIKPGGASIIYRIQIRR